MSRLFLLLRISDSCLGQRGDLLVNHGDFDKEKGSNIPIIFKLVTISFNNSQLLSQHD